MQSTCCGGYHPYGYTQPMYPQQVAGVYTGYPDGYGMSAFQVQPNIPGASLGGFGGAEEVKGFLDRDSQFAENIDTLAVQTNAGAVAGENAKTKAKTKTKKEVKVSGSTPVKNTSKKASSSSGKKRLSSESAKGRASGRRSLWIND
ncbi:hypothetical protein D3C78_1428490 [compost metagenome]